MSTTKKDPMAARYFMLNATTAKPNDYRPALRHIYCDGEHLVSTNARMLIWTANEEQLAAGFYDLVTTGSGREKKSRFVPVTEEAAKEWHFPDWEKLIPDCTGGKVVEFHGGASPETEIFTLQFTLASLGTGSLICQDDIDLLCKSGIDYTVRMIDGRMPLIFEAEKYSLLVMPKRAIGVAALLDAYRGEPEQAGTAPETPTPAPAPEPQAESAGEPAEPAQAAPEPAAVTAPMPEPVEMPEERREARKAAAKPKKRTRKAAFAYHCELPDGRRVTVDSFEAVQALGTGIKCRIEPVKKPHEINSFL